MFMFYKTDAEHAIDRAARTCARTLEEQPPPLAAAAACFDQAGAFVPNNVCAGAQGGAIAVRRSHRAASFARDWCDRPTHAMSRSILSRKSTQAHDVR